MNYIDTKAKVLALLTSYSFHMIQMVEGKNKANDNWPVGRAVTRSSLEREVCDSYLRPVKSNSVLPTARHRCDISSKGAELPRRNDAEMGPAISYMLWHNTASITKDVIEERKVNEYRIPNCFYPVHGSNVLLTEFSICLLVRY